MEKNKQSKMLIEILSGKEMIIPEATLDVREDNKGLFFDSSDVDLDKDSLVVPVIMDDGTGTIEFHRRDAILHPANGESKTFSVVDFNKFMREL